MRLCNQKMAMGHKNRINNHGSQKSQKRPWTTQFEGTDYKSIRFVIEIKSALGRCRFCGFSFGTNDSVRSVDDPKITHAHHNKTAQKRSNVDDVVFYSDKYCARNSKSFRCKRFWVTVDFPYWSADTERPIAFRINSADRSSLTGKLTKNKTAKHNRLFSKLKWTEN